MTRSIFAIAGALLAAPYLSPCFLTNAFSPTAQSIITEIGHGMIAEGVTEGEVFTSSSDETTESTDGRMDVLPAVRFIAQNRFRVRPGREAAFEKRWADRKSAMAKLPGFRFFCMLRLVNSSDSKGRDDSEQPNYVSSTVWDSYENFDTWKKGNAFKEAHGGGTIKGVVSMIAATARNTKGGKPKLAYWEGLLPTIIEGKPLGNGEDLRTVDADGETILPTDCFVAMNRFSVRSGMGNAFETKFASRESSLKDYDGFVGFLLFRRAVSREPGDGDSPDDGFTHSTFSVWKNRDAFEAWRSASASKPKPTGDGSGGPSNIYNTAPIPSYYEGILALESVPGI